MGNLKNNSSSSDLLYFKEYGSGPPLLLLHGLMVTGETFNEPIIERLATRYRLIVPDLRGCGRSKRLPPPYTTAQLAADLARLLDHLGIESAAVLGYSRGGIIAQQFALDYPKRCNRLILACTCAFNMATFREWIEGHIAPLIIRILGLKRVAKLVARGAKQLDKKRANRLAGIIADEDQKLILIAWKEVMAFDSRRRLNEIRCPTLVIAGSNDIATPIHHAKMLRNGIPGSQFVIIEGADHFLLWARADEFVRVVNKFLGVCRA